MKLWKIKISIYLYIFTANKMSINSVHVLLKEELISNIIAIFVAIYLNEYSNTRNLAVTTKIISTGD